MPNIAILVGNARYLHLGDLDCCSHDVDAMEELLNGTGTFASITKLKDTSASDLRCKLSEIITDHKPVDQLLFYFTGHGSISEDVLYYCAHDFVVARPNETGLSTAELHGILRLSDANLVVKIVDACHSGALMIKANNYLFPEVKQGFTNFIQFAPCLDSQYSLTGDPLSKFTDRFRSAALKKSEGRVFYSDIAATIRDDFLEDQEHTPHFITQVTGREVFVEDASRLEPLRSRYAVTRTNQIERAIDAPNARPLSQLEILQTADERFASRTAAQAFVLRLTEKLSAKITSAEFGGLFEAKIVKYSDFFDVGSRSLIIRVLRKEARRDNFVGVTLKEQYRRRSIVDMFANVGQSWLPIDESEQYDLCLNCGLSDIQLELVIKPRYVALNQFVLVVTCAPSLELCYVFERMTEHKLRDWGVFNSEGAEITARWYKVKWTDACDYLTDTIRDNLKAVIEKSIASTADRLSNNGG